MEIAGRAQTVGGGLAFGIDVAEVATGLQILRLFLRGSAEHAKIFQAILMSRFYGSRIRKNRISPVFSLLLSHNFPFLLRISRRLRFLGCSKVHLVLLGDLLARCAVGRVELLAGFAGDE